MKTNNFRELFQANMETLRHRHGAGQNSFSWAEGINRKIARRIARDTARQGKKL